MLTDVAARLERFYADNNTYTVTMTNLGFTGTSPSSGEGFYTAGVAAGPSGSIATSYTITVTPVAARWGGSGDSTCGALTLDSRGTQGSSAGSLSICWN
jgi:type IV pilus assembly protein PilE